MKGRFTEKENLPSPNGLCGRVCVDQRQELFLGLFYVSAGAQELEEAYAIAFQAISMELEQKWSSWDTAWHAYGMLLLLAQA